MSASRKGITENQNIVLFNQVDGVCPLCNLALMYDKKNAKHKQFEVAHIYPLNPTQAEIELLKNEEKLHDDVNNVANLIPLCKPCHTQFDTPRTLEDYRELLEIKRSLTRMEAQRNIWHANNLHEDLKKVIASLSMISSADEVGLNYMPKDVTKKLDGQVNLLMERKIKNYISEYYVFVKQRFSALDDENAGVTDIIMNEVKGYYLKQKQLALSRQEIIQNINSWFKRKTKPQIEETAEIMTAFFIQNCEVFE